MVSIQPQVNKNGKYSIKGTCSILGIHRNTLRRYTEQGLIKCSYRVSSKRKFYYGHEIVRFWMAE